MGTQASEIWPRLCLADIPHREQRRVELIEHASDERQELPSDVRQRHAPGRALQQGRSDRGLQSLDAAAERRLGQVQGLGRAMEPLKVHNCNKGTQIKGFEIDAHDALIAPIFAFQSSFEI